MSERLAAMARHRHAPEALSAVVAVAAAAVLVSGEYLFLAALIGLPALVAAFLYPNIALWGMLVFIPLEGFASLVPGSFTLPKLLGLVAFACFLGNYLLLRKRIHIDQSAKFFGVFVVWAFLTSFWAADSEAAYVMVLVVFQLFLFYVMCQNLMSDPGLLRYALFFYVVGCVIASLWAIKNYNAGDYATTLQRVSAVENMNPNDFARMMGFGLLVNLFLLFDGKTKWFRNFVIAAFPILFMGLILSKSRGGWMAFAIALVVIFVAVKKTAKVYAAAGAIVLLLVGTVLAGVHFEYFDAGFEERFEQTTDSRDPTAQRADIWKVGLSLVKHNPIGGVGINNFKMRFNDYLNTVKTDVFPGFNKDPHNIFLAVLGETGIVGFVLFGGVIWIIVRNIRRAASHWDSTMAITFMSFTLVAGLSATDYIRKWFWVSLVSALLLARRRRYARTGD